MRNPLRLGVVVCLIGSTFTSTQSGAASTAHNQEAPASGSTAQERRKPAGFGGIDILSDTMGVDFGPYLQRVLKTVKENWHLAPASAKGPKMMQGVVSIEFAILTKGKVAGMKLAGRTEDTPMNAAAWHAIPDSRFPPLPAEFPGQYLALRFHFVYNPPKPTDAILQYREGMRL